MDIGKHREDYTFYEGYEGEEEIIVSLPNASYHFWEGYFDDIFGDPEFSETGWKGFTRDYNELVNAFDDSCIECAVMPEEYLADLMLCKEKKFSYKKTTDVLNCLIAIMNEAEKAQTCILVRVN